MKKINTYLLFTTVFLLQAYLIRFSIRSYPTNLQELLIILTATTFLASGLFKIKNLLKHKVLIIFVLLTIISLLTTDIESKIDLIRHEKFLFFALALTFIFLETLQSKQERERGVEVMGLGAIAFGLFSIIYNLLGHNTAYDFRLLGPLDAAVYLAFYLSPFLIFFAIKWLNERTNKYLILTITAAAMLIATRSMGAIGATFIVVLLYLLKQHSALFSSKKVKIALLTATILVAGGIFYTKILPTLNTNYSSLDERGEIWATSASLMKNPRNLIFGTGLGQFQANYFAEVKSVLGREPLDYYVLQPHNIFFLFIFNYGLLGLIFILVAAKKTLKNLNRTSAFIILYFLIHGLIDTPIFKNDILILFILFLEMAISNPKPNPLKQDKDHPL